MKIVSIGDLSYGSFHPAFLEACVTLISECAENGIFLQPYSGVRSPNEQAKLWRQSRPTWQVEDAIRKLKDYGAPYIAKCLAGVGPIPRGPWATNALPGESWHQWGEALDCNILDADERVIKDGSHKKYLEYGKIAKALGLEAGVFWKHPDAGHVQLRAGSVISTCTWPEIDREMEKRFNN